jgi:hypothetical protein
MVEILNQNVQTYASRYELQLGERLGFGVHGTVFVAEDMKLPGKHAVKAHKYAEVYVRERDVYERLRQAGVSEVLGFRVPDLVRFDDELRVIEMTIVTSPFVLDFAGARLDFPPEFSDEIWAEWEAEKVEQFGPRWPKVRAVLAALEDLDIYVLDVSPRNIMF